MAATTARPAAEASPPPRHARRVLSRAVLLRTALSRAALAWALAAGGVLAQFAPSGMFTDHMVLQRDRPVPVWGTGAAGETLSVGLRDADGATLASARGSVGADGRWQVELPPLPAGGPHSLHLTSHPALPGAQDDDTGNTGDTIVLRDVLVGDVWLAAGQSNMEWELRLEQHAEQELPAAHHPRLRLFRAPKRPAGSPRADIDGAWEVCTPESGRHFSAVAYYFGVAVQAELDVPVGLVQAAWGGTPIETWTPRVALAAAPVYAELTASMAADEARHRRQVAAALPPLRAWSAAARRALESGQPVPPMPSLPDEPFATDDLPTGLWNGMVHPVVPFALTGFLWYQGENNRGDGLAYEPKQRALIAAWREAWGDDELPFLFVQLAPFRYAGTSDLLAEIREAQRRVLTLPGTGMAVTTDIGDLDDVHPRNKRDVGRRLARLALAGIHGRDMLPCGPLVSGVTREGAAARARFEHAAGLTTRDGAPPDAFELAGADGVFVPGTAVIEGDDVVVRAPGIAEPTRLRFAWDAHHVANLVNGADLPASPFVETVVAR